MKVIVTGDTGSIGQVLVQQLCKGLHEVIGVSTSPAIYEDCAYIHIQADINNIHWPALLDGVECFFHFASIPTVKKYDASTTYVNIGATHKILDAISDRDIKFVFASSGTVYGPHNSARTIGHQTNPSSVYGLGKKYCEDLILQYAHNYERIKDYVILRYVANFGPTVRHGVVYDIMRKLRSDDESLRLLGIGPGSTKPYIHVEESVEAAIEAGVMGMSSGIYNISHDDNISVEVMANILMDRLNIHKPLEWSNKSSWKGDDEYVHIVPTHPWSYTVGTHEALRTYELS